VAGLIRNTGKTGGSAVRGIAPDVTLIALKVLDANGAGRTSDVLAALEFAIANKSALGIDIINLSLGHPIDDFAATDPLMQAVERAVQAGIAVITSAGNYGRNPTTGEVGYAGITSPGNASAAITVGEIDTAGTAAVSDDAVTRYSSRGPT
jgi:serine protease AprX